MFETADGAVRVIDFMPPRGEAPDIVRIVEGLDGDGRDALRAGDPVRLRPGACPGCAASTTRGSPSPGRTPCACARRRRCAARTGRRSPSSRSSRATASRSCSPGFRPIRSRPAAIDAEEALARRRAVLARMGALGRACRRLPRRGAPVAAGAQGADLCADRRHRGRADHVAAGAARRRAQLGLPLLLAARRDADPAGDARDRLPRRGRAVAALAAARGRGRSGRRPDHVRHRRRAAAGRVRARLAARLRGLEPGPRRQRRVVAAPARRVRRDPRGLVPERPRRGGARLQRLVAARGSCSAGSSTAGGRRIRDYGRCAARPAISPTPR